MVGFVGPGAPEFRLLAGQVPLILWDQGDSSSLGPLTIECGGAQVAAPILTLSAPLDGGGIRIIVAFAVPAGTVEDVIIKQRDGTVVCSVDAFQPEPVHTGPVFLEPATLLSCLSDTGRVRVVRFLLQTCRTAFGLSADKAYIDNIQRLVDELSLRPNVLEPLCLLDKKFVLAAGNLPAPVGENPVAVTIASEAVHETPLPPMIDRPGSSRNNRRMVLLPLHRAAMSEFSRVVVLGSAGVAIRAVKAVGQSLEAAVSWMATHNRLAPPTRDYVLQCLTQLGQNDPGARDAVREVLLMSQATGGDLSGGVKGLVDIDCAIGMSDRLFVGGSIADPHGLVQAIQIVVGNWSAKIDRSAIQTFSTTRTDNKSGVTEAATGFVLLAGGDCPVPQFGTARFSLTLTSRASVKIAQVPLFLAGAEARDAILRAAPVAGVTESLLRESLLPAIDLVQGAIGDGSVRRSDPLGIGAPPENASVSLIVPFGGDLGLTKIWSAALGGGILCDAGIEFIVVAPSDNDFAAAERMLDALHRQYGIASRLVRAAPGMGPRTSFSTGAAAATRYHLLFLDEGCFPADKNSLAMLMSAVDNSQTRRLVGGTLFDPAGSIRRSGFKPPQGDSLGDPYEGFPASQLDSLPDQSVFACSSSFLAVARSDFEAIGGFSNAFLTRDWTDADFCLKARAQGCDVRVEHRSRAVCYNGRKRESDAVHALSSRLDAHRFRRDWQSEITGWSGGGGDGNAPLSPPDEHQPLSQANVGNPRWAA